MRTIFPKLAVAAGFVDPRHHALSGARADQRTHHAIGQTPGPSLSQRAAHFSSSLASS